MVFKPVCCVCGQEIRPLAPVLDARSRSSTSAYPVARKMRVVRRKPPKSKRNAADED